MLVSKIQFPKHTGIQCLMMPYIQGDSSTVPQEIRNSYGHVLDNTFIKKGDIGFLTIDESAVEAGKAQRAYRAKYRRALHTEVGKLPNKVYCWGGGGWAGRANVELSSDTKILLANSIDDTCALWDATHHNTSSDGDIGDCADDYPYNHAILMKAGEVHQIGILTPHESLPITKGGNRQFIRIVSSGVYGREPYFTKNPLMD